MGDEAEIMKSGLCMPTCFVCTHIYMIIHGRHFAVAVLALSHLEHQPFSCEEGLPRGQGGSHGWPPAPPGETEQNGSELQKGLGCSR